MKKFTIFFSLLILLSTHSFGMSIEQNIFGVYPKNKKPVYLISYHPLIMNRHLFKYNRIIPLQFRH